MMVRDLIERLEKATGPDRDLDVDIGEALGLANHKGPAYDRPYRDWARHYTASIDAALTLVPEGCFVTVDLYCISQVPNTLDWRAWVKRPVGDFEGEGACGLVTSLGHGINGAIALAAAAMKAREAMTHQGKQ